MSKTHIPVEYVVNADNLILSAKNALLAVVPVFIVVSGFTLGWNLYESGRANTQQRLLLGAVSESGVAAQSRVTEEAVSPLLTSSTEEPLQTEILAVNETSSAEQIAESVTPARSVEELERLIVEGEMAIIRLNGEISRIRNASVALVGEFDTNCGDWEDDCARYYVQALEKNNAAYNDLALRITEEEHLLLDLRNEMALMQ